MKIRKEFLEISCSFHFRFIARHEPSVIKPLPIKLRIFKKSEEFIGSELQQKNQNGQMTICRWLESRVFPLLLVE